MSDHDKLAHYVCEKMWDVFLGQNNSEFAELNGGLSALEDEARQALMAWVEGFPEDDCRNLA